MNMALNGMSYVLILMSSRDMRFTEIMLKLIKDDLRLVNTIDSKCKTSWISFHEAFIMHEIDTRVHETLLIYDNQTQSPPKSLVLLRGQQPVPIVSSASSAEYAGNSNCGL